MRVTWHLGPSYRVGFTGRDVLEYHDDQGTVTLATQMTAGPWGDCVFMDDLPPNFHLTREELMRRVWSAMAGRGYWGLAIMFVDKHGNDLPTPTRRDPRVRPSKSYERRENPVIVRWRQGPTYAAGFVAPGALEYRDARAEVTFEVETAVRPRRYIVTIDGLPTDFHLTRAELMRRIWSVTSGRWPWGRRVEFVDNQGNAFPTPTQRDRRI